MDSITWSDVTRFRIGEVTFVATTTERFRSTPDRFLVVKPRSFVERYQTLLGELRPERIVELGIFQGGSTAFLGLLCQPEKLVALDIAETPVRALEQLIEENDKLTASVRTFYGVDQSDADRVGQIMQDEFGSVPLDLVIDDASHRLGPTETSFNQLFPRLRPGGVYVIEDWSGLHRYEMVLESRMQEDPAVAATVAARLQTDGAPATPLSVMLFQLILASTYAPSSVEQIVVSDGWASITRGPADLDPSTFALSDTYSDKAADLIATPASDRQIVRPRRPAPHPPHGEAQR